MNKFLKTILGLLVSTLAVLYMLPHIPGVTVTSTPGEAVMFVMVEFVFLAGSMFVGILTFGAIFIVRAFKTRNFGSMLSLIALWEKAGYAGTMLGVGSFLVVLRAITIALTASIFSTVAIDGFVAALCASIAIYLAQVALGLVTDPYQYSPSKYREELAKAKAKFEAEARGDTPPADDDNNA